MFTFNHFNFNVFDLERSLKFYHEAFGLRPVREKNAPDGRSKIDIHGDRRSQGGAGGGRPKPLPRPEL